MTYQSHTPASTVQFEKIGQIAITVNDLDRARAFYRDTLGMRYLFDAGQMCFFQCGDIRLMIGATDKTAPRGGTILYFKVEDIHAVCGALEQRGVELVQKAHLVAKMPDHDLWMAFLKDLDGNVIGMMSEVRRAS